MIFTLGRAFQPRIICLDTIILPDLASKNRNCLIHFWLQCKFQISVTCFHIEMEPPIGGWGLIYMRGSGVEGLDLFLGFIFSPTGIFRPYIEVRQTHKSSWSFFRCSLRKPACYPKGGTCYTCIKGVCIWKVQFEPKNVDSLKILHPKILRSCISPTKNMGNNFHRNMS